MEASALQARPGLTRGKPSIGTSLLRLRSDEQLVELFRAGNDEAFRAIHDRYRTRLFAYLRQMLAGSSQDAEDALQDVFMKAFAGLRANDRELALRAWLYRVAHNRCIDQIRRATPPVSLEAEPLAPAICDPASAIQQREDLRRLVVDVGRLPDQQRSALLMRELSGMSYAELADTLELSVPAVKSVLVRARVSLAAAAAARDTACTEIRTALVQCHDRGVKPPATARRHLRDCSGCREFRASMRSVNRQLAAAVPAVGPLGALAKLLGLGGSAAAGGGGGATGAAAAGGGATGAATGAAAGGAVAGGGAVAASAAAGTGAVASGHLATLIAAAVVTAGGAVAIEPVLAPNHPHHARPAAAATHAARVNIATADTMRLAAIRVASKSTAAIAPAARTPTLLAAPTRVPASVGLKPKPTPTPSTKLPVRDTRFRMAGRPEANAPDTNGGSVLYPNRLAGRPATAGGSGSAAGTGSTATATADTNATVAGAANTYGQSTADLSSSNSGSADATGSATGTPAGSSTGTAAATGSATGTSANSTTGTGSSGSATSTAAGGATTSPASASPTGTVLPAGSTPPVTTTATPPPPSQSVPAAQTPASGTAPSSDATSSAPSTQASSTSGAVTTPTGSAPTQQTSYDGGAAMGSPASSATNQAP